MRATARQTSRKLAPTLAVAALAVAATIGAGRPPKRAPRPSPVPAFPSVLLPPDASERDRAVADVCQRHLGHAPGSVVAMDPRDGRVIAIVNPVHALFRAYCPCSVFKIAVAIAGLSEGVIDPETTYNCTNGCWTWPGHGPINLRRALAVSCNPYFERIGETLGYEKVREYAQALGLGALSGVNLPGETAGTLPSRVPSFRVGHLSSHATGITATPMQIAVLISAAVNGGVVFRPQLAPRLGFSSQERWRMPAKTVFNGLAEGFIAAVNEGSAVSAFDAEVPVGGKTGSCAHVGWFASYAPADRPETVIVVFLKGGNGHGASRVAGEIFREIYGRPPPIAGS
jgi:penicillin-binding protein 2